MEQQEREIRQIEIGGKILADSRRNLYLAMRFLDLALCAFAYTPGEDNHSVGTDGRSIYYDPEHLIDLYRESPIAVNRLYLHMTLHCVYRHLFRLEDRNRRLWDAACDIATEAVLDSLPHACVKLRLSARRDHLYREIRSRYKLLTADTAYRYLSELQDEDELARLELEFQCDDHNTWYHEDKNPKSRQQNRERWDDIANRMQTSMETMEKGIGHEQGNLYEQVEVENKERYDYKAFLRKFAVYREEMQADPDTFDYSFYTYGLSLYGNLPLIEPQETREVKKIQDFVIAIDTSFSCSEEQVKDFLSETCSILFDSESFFKKVHIRILQCDNRIRRDDLLTSREEMEDYIHHLTIVGRGGTDFTPVFDHVQQLRERGEFSNLKGLLYFTDGRGVYPVRKPPYEVAFIFLREDYVDTEVPNWAIRLEI